MPPPPCRGTGAAPRACAVLASCLRHACNEGKTTSPPPTHTSAPPRVEDEGREGRTAPPPPPPPRGQSGKVGRQRREGAGRTTRPCPSEARAVQPPAGGAPGVRTQGRKGNDGSHTARPPPPLQRDKCRASCLRRACDVLTPEDGQRGPPPHPFLPHLPRKGARTEGGGKGTWGGGRGQTDAPGGETGGGRWRRKKKKQSKPTRQGKKARRQGPKPRRTGGGRGDMGPRGTLVKYPTSGVWGPQRGKPPPHCSLALCLRRACFVPATCVLQREDDKGAPPPHTPPPPRGWGMTVAQRGLPPEDNAAGWGGSGERVRDGPHDRAQREHALCKPQRGNHRGCDRRVGRATTGATRQAPPPAAEGQVPRLVPAPCSRRAYASGQAARKPPPPTPYSSTRPRKGRGQRGDSEGTWGGAEDIPKRRGERRVASGGGKKKKGHQCARAGADSRGRRDTAGTRKHGKGRGKGGHPWGRKLGGRDQHRSERGGGLGWQEPAKDAGKVPDLRGLGAPPVSVSAPPKRRQ